MPNSKRILIVNRGEAALRAINAIAEARGADGGTYRSIALYTEADREAAFVRRADESHCLGAPFSVDPASGQSRLAYLDHGLLAQALCDTRADAAWVGWGFVSEDAAFAELCERQGVRFIGPPPAAMRRLADKIEAKRLAERVGVPVAAWSGGAIATAELAEQAAARIGYPLMIKASAGGGGRGIREVGAWDELGEAFRSASAEARLAFGDDRLFLEKRIAGGRHFEVQVLADGEGTVWTLGVRECSVQRRRQKLLEEANPAIRDSAIEARLQAYAAAICREVGYRNAGTVEFLYEPASGAVSFMEVNTRLQVEHGVTEAIYGTDLVQWQIHLAFGGVLPPEAPPPSGHAIELRLNAEDPLRGFAPAPGRVARLQLPQGPGIRVDSGVEEGDEIPPHFDSMIAKIIAWAPDRRQALLRLQRALAQTEVLIEGGASNAPFLAALLQHRDVMSGEVDTIWLEEQLSRHAGLAPTVHDPDALLVAAAEHHRSRVGQARQRFAASGERDQLLRLPGDGFDLQLGAKRCTCTVRETAADAFLLATDGGDRVEFSASVIDRYRRRLRVGARELHCSIIDQGSAYLVSVGGEAHYVSKLEQGVMRAPFPSVVVRVLVAEGDRVARGQPLFVVESMKVETTIAAEIDGVVTALLAQPAVHVAAGDLMARLTEEADAAGAGNGGFEFPARYRARDDEDAIGRAVATIEGLIRGYEPAEADVERAAARLQSAPRGPDLDAAECALLDRFRAMHDDHADASDEVRFRRARSAASLPRQVEIVRCILRRWRLHGSPAMGVGGPMGLAAWAEAIDGVSTMLADLARSTLRRSARQSPREVARDFELWRLDRFDIVELERESDLILIDATARDSRRDRRLFAFAETTGGMAGAERLLLDCLDRIREHHGGKAARSPYAWNRVTIALRQAGPVDLAALKSLVQRAAPMTRGLSIDQIGFRCRVADEGAEERIVITTVSSHGDVQLGIKAVSAEPIRPFSDHRARSAMLERRGLAYPYDLVRLLTSPGTALSDFPKGRFTEYDLDAAQTLVAVDRDWGGNTANLVVGEIVNFTQKFPEGIRRMIILGDPSKGMGSLGEAECRRILGALDRAAREWIPVEWFAVSSGARVSMDSGTENLDWTARVLRRIIELGAAGHEINVVVCGINVGAQSYWNAEATMLMEGRGMLIMVGDSAMVLTGKRALDYSGGVSAENETGIGGYERIMGPNGEAQHWAPSIEAACRLLFRHYDFCYTAPAEGRARRRASADPDDRDICLSPHRLIEGSGFTKVGEIFDDRTNADRKKPFDIRSVMRAVVDMDDMPLERWENWAGAEATVVWDAHIGGYPVRMVGFESYDLARHGSAAPDGPDRWTAGTLFPQGSKKAAKAIRRASANRPLVILANLSGFDGSPESMRRLQLESGAEIGRAIVEFKGPILFCLLSRYHGGAFVVFSKALNSDMEVIAIAGAKASVLGGAPAAAVVFASEIEKIVRDDPAIARMRARGAAGDGTSGAAADLAAAIERKRLELQAEWAARYDRIHDIERALEQGSIDRIIGPIRLRPEIIDAIGRKYNDITNI